MSCVKMKASFVLIQYVLIDALLSWLDSWALLLTMDTWAYRKSQVGACKWAIFQSQGTLHAATVRPFQALCSSASFPLAMFAFLRWTDGHEGRSSHSISGRIWHQGSSWPPVTWKGLTHSTQGNQQFLAASCGPCQIQKDKKNRNKKDKMCKLQIKMFGLAPECVLAKKLLCWYGLTAWSFISVSAVLGLPQDTKGWHKLHSLPESISMLWVSKLQQG